MLSWVKNQSEMSMDNRTTIKSTCSCSMVAFFFFLLKSAKKSPSDKMSPTVLVQRRLDTLGIFFCHFVQGRQLF